MKFLLFSGAPLLIFLAALGQVNPPADYTVNLTGTYTITYMNWDGDIAHMPEPGFSGTIRMLKADLTHLQMIFSVKAKGKSEVFKATSDPKQIELRPNKKKSFFLYDNNVKLGTITPKTISLHTTNEEGTGTVVIRASR